MQVLAEWRGCKELGEVQGAELIQDPGGCAGVHDWREVCFSCAAGHRCWMADLEGGCIVRSSEGRWPEAVWAGTAVGLAPERHVGIRLLKLELALHKVREGLLAQSDLALQGRGHGLAHNWDEASGSRSRTVISRSTRQRCMCRGAAKLQARMSYELHLCMYLACSMATSGHQGASLIPAYGGF